ncbi:hypothetical protein GA0070609_0717 [Micromonospora echinaurantiaca]|uniref:Uncharacterized protein n=1 Tax=Micromonospora echinaurantiaca TaxID=47857 RepID=A0A1C5H053_9ACTN|nr:hypothetical protein [Micromonospora echinaurantiaca]SCG39415.1 hypothetical protein GA0070609_0717 [Micromonospora echinaurantiaca]
MASVRAALVLVRCATALLPHASRARHLEQWQADVHGAAELGMSPLRLAAGTLGAAVRIAATNRKGPRTMQPIGPLALALKLVGGTHARRRAATLAAVLTATLLAGVGMLIAG